ncbi:unnamed protein product [Rhizoctonia solani]|uniref:Uncharacterized protein n=1 Tax=Rhizoctonia solani TaxID=456999 RepID=A0A8H3HQE2_9AGAM|nr:unnamed protein product [Rhizoctonia solani]
MVGDIPGRTVDQKPTPVEVGYLPSTLLGRGCIGNVKASSATTMVFATLTLQKLSKDSCGIYALALTHTRHRIGVPDLKAAYGAGRIAQPEEGGDCQLNGCDGTGSGAREAAHTPS